MQTTVLGCSNESVYLEITGAENFLKPTSALCHFKIEFAVRNMEKWQAYLRLAFDKKTTTAKSGENS